ncbi:MAG: hypothetical protein WC901_00625 [Candidatus Margulisiibacteriota bacterium]
MGAIARLASKEMARNGIRATPESLTVGMRYRLAAVGAYHDARECLAPATGLTRVSLAFDGLSSGSFAGAALAMPGSSGMQEARFAMGVARGTLLPGATGVSGGFGGGGARITNTDLFRIRRAVLEELRGTAERKSIDAPGKVVFTSETIEQALKLAASKAGLSHGLVSAENVAEMINMLFAANAIERSGRKKFRIAPTTTQKIHAVSTRFRTMDVEFIQKLTSVSAVLDLADICLSEIWDEHALCLASPAEAGLRLRMVRRSRPIAGSTYDAPTGVEPRYLRKKAVEDFSSVRTWGRVVDLAKDPAVHKASLASDAEDFLLPDSGPFKGEVLEGVGANEQGAITFEYEVSHRLPNAPALEFGAIDNPWLRTRPAIGLMDDPVTVAKTLQDLILRPLADRITEIANGDNVFEVLDSEGEVTEPAGQNESSEDLARRLTRPMINALRQQAAPKIVRRRNNLTGKVEYLTEYTISSATRGPKIFFTRIVGIDAWANIFGTVFNLSFKPRAYQQAEDLPDGIQHVNAAINDALHSIKIYVDKDDRVVSFAMLHVYPGEGRGLAKMTTAGTIPHFWGTRIVNNAYRALLRSVLREYRQSGMRLLTGSHTPNPALAHHIRRAVHNPLPILNLFLDSHEGKELSAEEREDFIFLLTQLRIISPDANIDDKTLVIKAGVLAAHRVSNPNLIPWATGFGGKKLNQWVSAHANLMEGDLIPVYGVFTLWTPVWELFWRFADWVTFRKVNRK